jgi:hypothetical protein
MEFPTMQPNTKPQPPVNDEVSGKSADMSQLLEKRLGVLILEDDADIPGIGLLIVKRSASKAVFRLALQVLEESCLPFVIAVLLCAFT